MRNSLSYLNKNLLESQMSVMTNFEFIMRMTPQEFAKCVIDDSFLNMPCVENKEECDIADHDCEACVAKWLGEEIEVECLKTETGKRIELQTTCPEVSC